MVMPLLHFLPRHNAFKTYVSEAQRSLAKLLSSTSKDHQTIRKKNRNFIIGFEACMLCFELTTRWCCWLKQVIVALRSYLAKQVFKIIQVWFLFNKSKRRRPGHKACIFRWLDVWNVLKQHNHRKDTPDRWENRSSCWRHRRYAQAEGLRQK